MRVCACVCMRAQVCVCVCACVYCSMFCFVSVCVRTCTYSRMYKCVCVCVCVYVCVCAIYFCAHTNIYTHISITTFKNTYSRSLINTHTHTKACDIYVHGYKISLTGICPHAYVHVHIDVQHSCAQ